MACTCGSICFGHNEQKHKPSIHNQTGKLKIQQNKQIFFQNLTEKYKTKSHTCIAIWPETQTQAFGSHVIISSE